MPFQNIHNSTGELTATSWCGGPQYEQVPTGFSQSWGVGITTAAVPRGLAASPSSDSPPSLPFANDETLRRWGWDGSSPHPVPLTPSLPIQHWLLSGMNCQVDPEALVQPCAWLSAPVLPYRWPQGQLITVNSHRAWLHLCSRDKTVPHISPLLSAEVCREKTIF